MKYAFGKETFKKRIIIRNNKSVGYTNFQKHWKTLSYLGKLLNVSSIKFGKLLKDCGIRDKNGKPTKLAENLGFCHPVKTRGGEFYWLYNIRVIDYLESKGFIKIPYKQFIKKFGNELTIF